MIWHCVTVTHRRGVQEEKKAARRSSWKPPKWAKDYIDETADVNVEDRKRMYDKAGYLPPTNIDRERRTGY